MKKTIIILNVLILILITSGYAQNTGINTKTPTTTLDVNGNARVRTLPTGAITDLITTADASGNLRTMAGLIWDPTAPRLSGPYMEALGGTDLNFGAGNWAENTYTDLKLDSSTDPDGVYNATTGVATIKKDGFYQIQGQVRLVNNPGTTLFNGASGQFNGALFVKPNSGSTFSRIDKRALVVLAGVKETPGAISGSSSLVYDLNFSSTLYLVVGDQVKMQFSTVATSTLNTNTNLILISRGTSYFRLYRF